MDQKKESISVVMAACNGSRYITQQIDSILKQLEKNDELIISVDPSSDDTWQTASSIEDSRLKVLKGPGRGISANFENGLRQASSPIVFLSDQDDIWLPDKRKKVLQAFEDSNVYAVCHDCRIVDENGQILEPSFFKAHQSRNGFFQNILRNSWIGCCMAFRKEVLERALPMNRNLPMHDQWIALEAMRMGKTRLLPEVLLEYRRHGKNASSLKSSSISQQIRWRLRLIQELIKRETQCRHL